MPAFFSRGRSASVMFSRMLMSGTMPSILRSSETKPDAVRDRVRRLLIGLLAARPCDIVPRCIRSAPKMSRAVSVRPEPSRPGKAGNLALAHVRLTSRTRTPAPAFFDLEAERPVGHVLARRYGLKAASSLPSMWRTSAILGMSAIGLFATVWPSRMIVTRSQIA
jgi:hypothetical protein